VSAGISPDYITEGVLHRLEERLGDAGWWLDAQRVAEPGGVFGRRPLLLASEVDADQATGCSQGLHHFLDREVPGSQVELFDRERAEIPKEVHHCVWGTGRPFVGEALQLEFDGGDHIGGEELAELAFAEELSEEVPVEGQRRRPPLG